jgi:hypothetical protein
MTRVNSTGRSLREAVTPEPAPKPRPSTDIPKADSFTVHLAMGGDFGATSILKLCAR